MQIEKKLAIFDFDGTLYPFETFTFLIDQLKKQKSFRLRHYLFTITFFVPYMKYKLKLIPKQRMRELALKEFIQLFRGLTEPEIYDFFENAYRDMKDRVNAKVRNELLEWKDTGYLIILVSGAVKPLLEIMQRDIPFDIVIGSNIPITHGVYDELGEINYIQGNQKVVELQKALDKYKETYKDEHGDDVVINWTESVAYADSESDLPILEMVGNPVCVAPDNPLKHFANDKHWRIM